MRDQTWLQDLLDDAGFNPVVTDGRLVVRSEGLRFILQVTANGTLLHRAVVGIPGGNPAAVLAALNQAAGSVRIPGFHVQPGPQYPLVRYGTDVIDTALPDQSVVARIRWFHRCAAIFHRTVAGLLAGPDPSGPPLRWRLAGFVGVVCPTGHQCGVTATDIHLSLRGDGSADAIWHCRRCDKTVRRTLAAHTAQTLAGDGAGVALTASEVEVFAAALDAVDDPVRYAAL